MFVAKIVFGAVAFVNSRNIFSFSSTSSVAASITMSTSLKLFKSVVVVILDFVSCLSASVILFFEIAFWNKESLHVT